LPLAAYESYTGLPASMSRRTSPASDTGFSLRHFLLLLLLLLTVSFSCVEFFRSQPAAKSLPAWVMTLL